MNRQNLAASRAARRPWRMPNLPRLAAALLLAAAFAYLAALASSTDYSAYEARALRPAASVTSSADAVDKPVGERVELRVSERPAKSRLGR